MYFQNKVLTKLQNSITCLVHVLSPSFSFFSIPSHFVPFYLPFQSFFDLNRKISSRFSTEQVYQWDFLRNSYRVCDFCYLSRYLFVFFTLLWLELHILISCSVFSFLSFQFLKFIQLLPVFVFLFLKSQFYIIYCHMLLKCIFCLLIMED